ncbi:MAG: hypothetical protein QGF38_02035 [Rhodospirillales bacterium]|nr:hypothetical protein [Rhodospirillales bacterium]MDP7650467.1 hypothetical protein [Rhodospirillales bacterium]
MSISPPATVKQVVPGAEIRVDSLQIIDPDSAGTLGEAQGGLGVAMWSGTNRKLVDRLLPQLPVNTTSRAMRDLEVRLLLSRAVVPEGDAPGGGLVALRVRLLAAIGDLAGVDDLLGVIPAHGEGDDLARVESDMSFLTNDNNRACSLARGRMGAGDIAYWQKAFIFCQALAQEHSKAALGVALLRESGDQDAVFFTLINALAAGGGATIEDLPDPSPLHLAMARVAKAHLPPNVIASDRPGVLRTIAISPNVTVELRLEAAERAESAGALDVDTLRQLYTSVSFTAEELASPLSRAEAEAGPMSRALLYRTALVQTVPTARAEAVARALDLGREGGRHASTARAFEPILKRIPPSAEMAWFAPQAIRAFLVIGDHQAARPWFQLLDASARFDERSAAALDGLAPLARLAGSPGTENWSADKMVAWWKGVEEEEGAGERASLLYALFESLGETVPETLWEALLGGTQQAGGAMTRPALWRQLGNAAAAGRVGETVLLSLLMLGQGGPGQASPLVLGRVVGSLNAVGLDVPARAIAVEALVAAGL